MKIGKYKPYPEILIPGPEFRISQSRTSDLIAGRINIRKREVDITLNEHSLCVVRHEMGHAKWSPTTVPKIDGVPQEVIQCFEDARINSNLMRRGLDATPPDFIGNMFVRSILHSEMQGGTYQPSLAAVSMIGTRDIDLLLSVTGKDSVVAEVASHFVETLDKAMGEAGVATFEWTVQSSKEFVEMLGASERPKPKLKPKGEERGKGKRQRKPSSEEKSRDKGKGSKIEFETRRSEILAKKENVDKVPIRYIFDRKVEFSQVRFSEAARYLVSADRAQHESEEDAVFTRKAWCDSLDEEASLCDRPYRDSVSGEMAISHHPLKKKIESEIIAKSKSNRFSDTGYFVSRPDRFMVDRCIFSSNRTSPSIRRRSECAVLIDVSGSMSLSEQDIERIVNASKGFGVVAIYSGLHYKGDLSVIARDERVCDLEDVIEERGSLSHNVVDIPALRWLARQPHRRKLWVCDGYPTGLDDSPYGEICIEAQRIMDTYNIIRCNEVDDACRVLESGDEW